MITQSFYTLVFVTLISFIALIMVSRLTYRIPTREILFIMLALLSEFLGYIFYAINYYYSTPTQIDTKTHIFHQFGYFFAVTAIMFVTLALMLIDFKFTYNDILELLIFCWISGANAAYNTLTLNTVIYDHTLDDVYTPLGVLLILIFFMMVIYIWVKRFLKIYRIYNSSQSLTNPLREFSLFIVIGSLLIVIYMFLVINLSIHGDYSFIAGGVFTIIGVGILVKNNAFVFITDIQVDSLIVIDKNSGIRLYSRIFAEKGNSEVSKDETDFIGSIISAINTSFSDTINSHKDLTEMNFSNKRVLISTGEYVRSILILSSSNLIAKEISNFVVKRFEKLFGKKLEKNNKDRSFVIKNSDYKTFDGEVEIIRRYLPL